MQKWLLTLCGIGLMAVTMGSFKAVAAEEATAIRIGAIFAETGPAANLGAPEAKTVRMLVDQINAAGGIKGRPIKLIIEDSEYRPQAGMEAAGTGRRARLNETREDREPSRA